MTPFLRVFIPGQAEHALILKEAYQRKENVDLPLSSGKNPKKSVRTTWIDKPAFEWTARQQESFDYIKKCITENAMSGSDPDRQFHLATDASNQGIGGILFQLAASPAGTEATDKLKQDLRIIMFLSFKLNDAETRYSTTEREALAVVRCLAEVRWLVMGNRHPTKVYTDHIALTSILSKGTDEHGRIARWLDRLTKYDLEIHHRPSTTNVIGIADGLSRLPGSLLSTPTAFDNERMALTATVLPNADPASPNSPPLRLDLLPEPEPQETLPMGPARPPLAMTADPYSKWRASRWYQRVVDYLTTGSNLLKSLSHNAAKLTRRRALRFVLTDQHLLYTEKNGMRSICALPQDLPGILHHSHDSHGHFAAALTLDRLVGEWYWPTRASDVQQWCRSCHVCQLTGPRRRSTEAKPIIRFEPWAMVGMDFLGPIAPASDNGSKYILIVVDYFSRMTFARDYTSADSTSVNDMWVNHLSPIMGWPATLYCDNATYFVGNETRTLFHTHGTQFITAPITHPASVGLAERAVQMVGGQVRKWVLQRGHSYMTKWAYALTPGLVNINTRLIRVHGFTPAEILLGFKPKWHRVENRDVFNTAEATEALQSTPGEHWSFIWEFRNEQRDRMAHSITEAHDRAKPKDPMWTTPKPGDWVLVRRSQFDNKRGNKLEAKWDGPKLLTRVTESGVSGFVKNIYGEGIEKRYHLDDLKTYIPRTYQPLSTLTVTSSRDAMAMACRPTMKGIDLPSLFLSTSV